MRTTARRPSRRITTLAILGALVVAFSACSDDDGSGNDAADDEPPKLESVTAEPGTAGLTAAVSVTTDAPARVAVTATSAGGHRVVTPTTDDASEQHEVALLGLRAQQTYDLAVTVEGADGRDEVVESGETFTTEPLPAQLPDFAVESQPDKMAPGVVLFNLTYWLPQGATPAPVGADGGLSEDPGTRPDAGWVVAVDAEGNVVWYYPTLTSVWDVAPTDDGTLLIDLNESAVREIDMLGNTVHEWSSRLGQNGGTDLTGKRLASDDAIPVDVDSLHHDVHELPNGNFIGLGTELIELPADVGARLCPDAPARNVAADVVIEFTREGDIVDEWRLQDVYDPAERPGTEMCIEGNPIAPPNWFYNDVESVRDWTHGNAVELDEENNTLILSLRHLDAVLGIRYHDDDDGSAGDLLWELGPEGDLDLEGDGEYTHHQHAPELQEDGSLLIYDNGNFRPGTVSAGGTEPNFSRAVWFDVDLEAGTARQRWEHRDTTAQGQPVFTMFLGDVDRTSEGTVLITHGARLDETQQLTARLVEVVPGTDGADDEIVFDLSTQRTQREGWTTYRSEKVPSLYLDD